MGRAPLAVMCAAVLEIQPPNSRRGDSRMTLSRDDYNLSLGILAVR